MSSSHDEDEKLARAFLGRQQTPQASGACPEAERLYEAASGELPAAQRLAVLDHVAGCAECTEAWRLALEISESGVADSSTSPAAVPIRRDREPAGLRPAGGRVSETLKFAIAAGLVIAIGLTVYIGIPTEVPAPAYREVPTPLAPASLTPDALPRERFLLQWSAGPAGSTYTVRLMTMDLQPVLVENGVAGRELLVPSAVLDGLASGTRLLWQVDARLADGQQIVSAAYAVTLE